MHTANSVQKFLAKHNFKMLQHPLYNPDLAPADFFFFTKVKVNLEGLEIAEEDVKTSWEGAVLPITKEDFKATFKRWLERHQKCISLDGDYVEKSD